MHGQQNIKYWIGEYIHIVWDTGIDDDVRLLGKGDEKRVHVLWEDIGQRKFVEWEKAD
jgi:hypothetical protein